MVGSLGILRMRTDHWKDLAWRAVITFQPRLGNLLGRKLKDELISDAHAHITELPRIPPPPNAGLGGLPASEHVEDPRGWCENGSWETCSRPWSVRSSGPQIFWLLFEAGGSPAAETSTCGT